MVKQSKVANKSRYRPPSSAQYWPDELKLKFKYLARDANKKSVQKYQQSDKYKNKVKDVKKLLEQSRLRMKTYRLKQQVNPSRVWLRKIKEMKKEWSDKEATIGK